MRTSYKDFEVRNMREDAMTCVNLMSAIIHECESGHVSPRYIGEKITKARYCIDYITALTFQEEDHD